MVITLIQLPQIVGYYLILNLDIISFFLIGYLFTRSIPRSLMIYFGFLISQISLQSSEPVKYLEWLLEICGLVLILIGMWGLKDEKEQLKKEDKQIQRWGKESESFKKSQTVIYDGRIKKNEPRKKRTKGRKTA